MKLLFIVPNNYQKVGGYKLPINNYKRCFEEKGIEVDLLPISLKSSEFRRIDNIQRLKEEVSKHDLIMP